MVRRHLFHIFLTGLVIFALAFAAAPWFAFRAMKAGARDGDVAALAELVDFRAVRASLRDQVRAPEPARVERPGGRGGASDIWRDPLGAMRRALEPLAEPLAPLTAPPARLEPYLAPEGLYDLSRGYAPGAAPDEPPSPAGVVEQASRTLNAPWPALRYWGVNRVRFAVHPPSTPGALTVFTFQRTSLFGWKLVHIGLPEPTAG